MARSSLSFWSNPTRKEYRKTSILFGQIEPGGLINVVTKKPLSEPFYEAELQLGNQAFVRPRIDISGLITSDRSVLYRLNALYLHEESFRDFDTDIERYFIAPSLTFKIGNHTDLNFQLEYLNDERPFDTGLVALGDEVADIPRDRLINEPDDFIEKESLNIGYNLEHRFSENWTLRNAFRYDSNDDSLETAINFPFIGTLDESTGELNRSFAIQNVDGDRQGDLDNSFELDSYFLTNAGIYYQRENWRTALNFKNLFDINYITGTPINRTRGIQPGEPFTVIGSVSVQF